MTCPLRWRKLVTTKPRWGLTAWLALLVLGAVVPLFLFAGVILYDLFKTSRAASERGQVHTTRVLALAVDGEVRSWRAALEALATGNELRGGHWREFDAEARAVAAQHDGWLVINDASGQQRINTLLPTGAPLPKTAAPDMVQAVFRDGKPVTDMVYGAVAQRYIISNSIPVFRDGKVVLCLSLNFGSERLTRLLQAQQFPATWVAAIHDGQQRVVARSRDAEARVGKPVVEWLAAAKRAAASGIVTGPMIDGRPGRVAFQPLQETPWSVALTVPVAELQSAAPIWSFLLVGALLGLAAVGTAVYTGRKVTAPVKSLAQSSAGLLHGEAGDLGVPSGIREVHELQQALAQAAAAARAHADERERAAEAVWQANEVLEARVLDRTAALGKANEALQAANVALQEEIEHRKGAEEEVRNLAKFPSENPNPVLRLDADGRVLFGNAASKAVLRQWECAVGSQAPSLWPDIVRQALASRSGTTVELVCGDRTYAVFVAPIVEAGYVNLYTADITERKRAEEQLRLSSEALASAANGVAITDRQGTLLWVNPAFTKLTGYSREEAVGQNPRVLKSGQHPPEFYREMWHTILSGEPWRGHVVNRRKDGTLYDEEMTITPVRADGGGDITHFIAIKENITARKQAEEALRESREDLKRAQAVAHTGSWRLDTRRNLLQWSDETYRMFGISPGTHLTYEAFLAAVHPLDRHDVNEKWRAAVGGAPYDIEHRILVGDAVKWVRERAELEFDKDGVLLGGFGTVQDITGRKLAELALRDAFATMEARLQERTVEPPEPRLTEPGAPLSGSRDLGTLGQDVGQRAEELVALDRIAEVLASSLDLDAILPPLLAEVRQLLDADAAGVMLLDPGQETLRLAAADGAALEPLRDIRVPVADSLVGQVLRARQGILVNDVEQDPRVPASFRERTAGRIRSTILAPLICKGEVLGTLGAVNRSDGLFLANHLRTLCLIASTAAVAIDNARLFAAEETRRRQLEAVRAVTAEITQELDPFKLLHLIADCAAGLVGAQNARAWLWSEQAQCLVVGAVVGHGEQVTGWTPRLGEGVVGLVAERRKGLIVNDYRSSPHAHPRVAETTGATAVMAEPILSHGRLFGVIAVDNDPTGKQFTEDDGQLLALFATHIAIAVENARMFDEVQRSQARLERVSRRLVEIQEEERRAVARELHDEIGQALTALRLILGMATRASAAQQDERWAEAQALVTGLLSQVRELSLNLRPAVLDDLGLLPALLWHGERIERQTGLRVNLVHTGLEDRRFPPTLETAVFRTVQEALTNVVRHAGVQQVTVRVWADAVALGANVEDQGAGFDVEAALSAHRSTGLSSIQERATLLNGHLSIDSQPGAGTRITVEFPLTQGAPPAEGDR
jgi:PAS domain S-box-containing protein